MLNKRETLKGPHKQLKAKYKTIGINVYVDDDADVEEPAFLSFWWWWWWR